MKRKHEIPNKAESVKINSFNFIEWEKFYSELVHEENAGKIQWDRNEGQRDNMVRETSDKLHAELKQEAERRTTTEIITIDRTDFDGSAPKRYVTKCYIQPVISPVWYRESLFLNIGSTKKKFDEQIYFRERLLPTKWSENMTTEIKTLPRCVNSELVIPIDDYEEGVHYISLEAQQTALVTDL